MAAAVAAAASAATALMNAVVASLLASETAGPFLIAAETCTSTTPPIVQRNGKADGALWCIPLQQVAAAAAVAVARSAWL